MKRAFLALALASVFHLPAYAAFVAEKAPAPGEDTLLQADEIIYDDDANTVTATGTVEIQRGDRVLLADRIVYDRNKDIATATGHVSLLDDTGSVFFFETIQVTGDLKQGLAEEVRVLLADKSRMASRAFRRRSNAVSELYQAVYSPCDSCKGQDPLWQIKAAQVRYDRDAQMVYYDNAWLEIKGVPVLYTPYLAHPDPTAGATSGLLLPTIGASRNLGAFYKQPYYIAISPDQDATITPFVTANAGQGSTFEYRRDFRNGQVRLDGSLMANDPELNEDVRGHFIGWSRFDLDENWRTGTDINLASDQTYLRRYNFKAPSWLTSNVFAERFTQNSYFSANAYYFQRQRVDVTGSSVPVVAPLLEYNYLTDPDSIGSYWSFDANSLVLFRETGTDTNRLSGRVAWNLPYTMANGSVFTVRADVRADGYYVRDLVRPKAKDVFTGTSGRAIPEASVEWRLPLVSDEMGFHQVLEPIVMLAASPNGINSENIPNEDSLDLEFDDTNLFSIDRFAGFDRVESGPRLNYGLRWSVFNETAGTVSAQIGQVYRFKPDPSFTPLSGLAGHFSDFVGHVDYMPNALLNFDYRFRVDKDNLSPRRSELGARVGPDLMRVGLSYIFVKADVNTLDAIGSTEEIYAYLSSRFSEHWSVVASHRQNLGRTGGSILSDIGLTYEDECFVLGLTVANDNTEDRDFKKGIAVMLRFGLKTIGDIKFNTDVGARR
ncbi:MAG: LPS-assembly protein LptD [Rhodospirillaceae bacterium]